MSKGSNRRPGTGFEAGYDGIDWGRKEEPEWLEHFLHKPDGPCEVLVKYASGKTEGGAFRIVNRKDGPELCLICANGSMAYWSGLGTDKVTHWAHPLSSKPDARQHVRDVADGEAKE